MSHKQREAVASMLGSQPQDPGPQSVEQLRAEFVELMARFAVPANIRKTATTLGTRPALLVEPEGDARPGTILYFHGGSFVLGSPETAIGLTANLVTRTGFRSISLDYRLAPEHPFPAAIKDCLAAYRALLDDGVAPSAIAFAGDSAGGSLSVTTCLAARAAGLPMPAAIVTFSPVLDSTYSGETMTTKKDLDPFFTRESMAPAAAMYLAGQDPMQELASPAVLADLTGLPPILLQVGTNEVLLDDAVRLARRAQEANVDVVLDITANVPHVFQSFVGTLDESGEALDRAALFLTQRLATG